MNPVALSFSGGGFRAAAFSLGVLAYLQRVRLPGGTLLEEVKYISSASGGSITNLLYNVALHKGRPFSRFYADLHRMLEGERLIGQVFRNLRSNAVWKALPGKQRNLINAFATVYDGYLEGEVFGLFWDKQHRPHIEEICVNATEFTNGITFRFQTDGAPKQKINIGNKYLYFRKTPEGLAVARRLKLADILAASSCFPSGFEPVLFPDDFAHAGLGRAALQEAITVASNALYVKAVDAEETGMEAPQKEKKFGLMDGGITDNQGINSFMLAHKRRSNRGAPPFGLFLVCDVASHYMDAYHLPTEKHRWYTAFSVNSLITGIKVVAALGTGAIALLLLGRWLPLAYSLLTLSLLSAALWWAGKSKAAAVYRQARASRSTWGTTLFRYLDYFLRVRFSILQQMIAARVKSVGILAADVYLKQIRRLSYQILYDNEALRAITVTNFIYALSSVNAANRRQNLSGEAWWKRLGAEEREGLEPGPALTAVADTATRMDTTLWFDAWHLQQNAQAAVTAAGMFTTCYNLLGYVYRLEEEGTALPPEWAAIKALLLRDWAAFREDPYFLYNSLAPEEKG